LNLFEQIQQAVKYCNLYEGYKVGIFVDSLHKLVSLSELLYQSGFICQYKDFRITRNETLIVFPNGSYIKIQVARVNCCGQRFNMVIVDDAIDYTVKTKIILPCLINYVNYKSGEGVKFKRSYADFSNIWKSFKDYRDQEGEDIMEALAGTLGYETLTLSEATHAYPFKVFEENNTKVLFYNAIGISEFEYGTEFINRKKETYLNIKGECDWADGEYKNTVDIHLKIDTEVYDRYEVTWKDGILVVTLFEIINEAPKFENVNTPYCKK